ncbi:MAG: phage major capsid protein [Candidatus Improbicoccus devescovinae]|nr:MAG: phage major capsid protein [Candidatus Improbicoccus devescovinae]
MPYDLISLEKDMYQVSKKSFTEVLEDLDPSENYLETDLAGLDAYERQLKRFEIKVNGPNCDSVEKFFENYHTAVLFPEFMARSIKSGLSAADALPMICATKTITDGIDFRPIILNTTSTSDSSTTNANSTASSTINSDSSSENTSTSVNTSQDVSENTGINLRAPISEGASLPVLNITTNSNIISLKKRGRLVSVTYESLRHQNLEVFGVILKKIGRDISYEQLGHAASVLSADAGTIDVSSTSSGKITYDYLLQLWEALNPYELNTMLANVSTIHAILGLTEMKDAAAGLNFQASGKLVTPLGANLIKTPDIATAVVIGLDKNCALQMIQSGNIILDYDKVISKQLKELALTVTSGFNKLFPDSVKKLVY